MPTASEIAKRAREIQEQRVKEADKKAQSVPTSTVTHPLKGVTQKYPLDR